MKGDPKNVPAPLEGHRKGLQVLVLAPQESKEMFEKEDMGRCVRCC